MALRPEDVATKQFATSSRLKPGYDESEVDDFLDEVESELRRLQRENDELRERQQAQVAAGNKPGGDDAGSPGGSRSGAAEAPVEGAARILALAQRTADELAAESQAEAERLRSEAQAEAQRLRTESRAEADRLVAEARTQTEAAAHQLEARRAAELGALQEEQADLERRIDDLRAFEGEYRSRLRAYLESQLDELSAAERDAAPAPDLAAGAS